MPDVIDDKSKYYIPFIVERLKLHQAAHVGKEDPPPFVIGMNGVQGAGKTTLVCSISCSEFYTHVGYIFGELFLQSLIEIVKAQQYLLNM